MPAVYPSLLLSPNGSFGKSGAVTTTMSGTGVTVVAGQYGNAWRIVGGTVTTPFVTSHASAARGTIIIRARRFDLVAGSPSLLLMGASAVATRILLYQLSTTTSGYTRENGGTLRAPASHPALPLNTWSGVALDWGRKIVGLTTTGTPRSTANRIDTSFGGFGAILVTIGGATLNTEIESVLIYPERLSSKEIERILAMPAAWTMTNAIAEMRPAYPETPGKPKTVGMPIKTGNPPKI